MSAIFHIATREAFLEARQAARAASRESAVYRTESLSREGFIHFSRLHQILQVADSYYRGQQGLVLLEVDPARVQAEVKYEPPVHPVASGNAPAADQLFPHLYGPLNLDAVVEVYDLAPNPGGAFSLPAALLANTAR